MWLVLCAGHVRTGELHPGASGLSAQRRLRAVDGRRIDGLLLAQPHHVGHLDVLAHLGVRHWIRRYVLAHLGVCHWIQRYVRVKKSQPIPLAIIRTARDPCRGQVQKVTKCCLFCVTLRLLLDLVMSELYQVFYALLVRSDRMSSW